MYKNSGMPYKVMAHYHKYVSSRRCPSGAREPPARAPRWLAIPMRLSQALPRQWGAAMTWIGYDTRLGGISVLSLSFIFNRQITGFGLISRHPTQAMITWTWDGTFHFSRHVPCHWPSLQLPNCGRIFESKGSAGPVLVVLACLATTRSPCAQVVDGSVASKITRITYLQRTGRKRLIIY